jgi:phage shock protein A
MLDKAEDPEKLVKLMIREMEDTLVEIKASCAGVMASSKKVQRMLDEVRSKENYWEEKAKLAVEKGRDDLAREALIEKRKYTRRAESLEDELVDLDAMVDQYKNDMGQLEDKLKTANEKRRMLVQRHIRALRKKQAQEESRRIDSAEAVMKFDELENRIERMEIEADLVHCGVKSRLEDELDSLAVDDDIEKQLEALKSPLLEKNEKS